MRSTRSEGPTEAATNSLSPTRSAKHAHDGCAVCEQHNAANSALLAALEAIAHQLTHGEASEGDERDIAWCAAAARAAIRAARGEE